MLNFIERKTLDARRLEELLAASRSSGHWANFGPASDHLERTIAEIMKLPEGRSVVACASGTAALFAMAGLAAWRRGRRLRWLVSAFGFLSSAAGPLARDIKIVDCGPDGMLSLDAAAAQPDESWDGMIATNVFGASSRLDAYRRFCAERGKYLVVDNSTCLFGFNRTGPDPVDEIVSFHHTKPWGFGEGGCAILDTADVPRFRILLNSGHGAPEWLRPYAANGKMSDVAAAAIAVRLESRETWGPLYRAQHRRLGDLAAQSGWRMLRRPLDSAVPAFVPLLSETAVPQERLAKSAIPLGKYYPPIRDLPQATDLYRRIVCMPCHGGLEQVTDAEIAHCLAELTGRDASRAPVSP